MQNVFYETDEDLLGKFLEAGLIDEDYQGTVIDGRNYYCPLDF